MGYIAGAKVSGTAKDKRGALSQGEEITAPCFTGTKQF
jgi:hypothetical protein